MATTANPDVPSLFKERSALTPPVKKKKSNPTPLILLFLMVALIAFGVVRNSMSHTKEPETVNVVGSGVELMPGTRLTFHHLHYITMPKKYFSSNMFTSSEQLVGYTTRLYMPMGEPVTKDALFDNKKTLSGNLETYERAVTLKLDDDSLVDHYIYPNDYVDVLVTSTKEGKHFTKIVCQNVRVLLCLTKNASDSKTNTSQNKITLAAAPDQAELLSEAAEVGKIRLALRSNLSRVKVEEPGVGEDDLLPAKAIKKPTPTVLAAARQNLIAPPPLPALPSLGVTEPPPTPEPIQWLVEMFTGSHKDTYAVPLSKQQ